jgi:hypothetical protein
VLPSAAAAAAPKRSVADGEEDSDGEAEVVDGLDEDREAGEKTENVSGRTGIAVSARVVAVAASRPAAPAVAVSAAALALPTAGLALGLGLPTSSAGKGTFSFFGSNEES